MKINLISLMLLTIFTSCQGQDKPKKLTTENAEQAVNGSKTDDLSKQNACEAITLESISNLMGIDKSAINQEDMSFGEKRSICYYYTERGRPQVFYSNGLEE